MVSCMVGKSQMGQPADRQRKRFFWDYLYSFWLPLNFGVPISYNGRMSITFCYIYFHDKYLFEDSFSTYSVIVLQCVTSSISMLHYTL